MAQCDLKARDQMTLMTATFISLSVSAPDALKYLKVTKTVGSNSPCQPLAASLVVP
jgi:hypothetical protein